MIGEYRRCGGRGWHLYDSAFRQQIVSLEEVDFQKSTSLSTPLPSQHMAKKGTFCTSCMLSDHQSDECALHPHRSVPVVCMGQVTLSKPDKSRPKYGDNRKEKVSAWSLLRLERWEMYSSSVSL